jgi:hypothetical protein
MEREGGYVNPAFGINEWSSTKEQFAASTLPYEKGSTRPRGSGRSFKEASTLTVLTPLAY